MKITDAKIYLNSPGRNYLTIEIHTDEGVIGLGDGTLNGRELAVYSYLKEHLFPSLIGRDPFDTEDIWNFFYRGAYWRRGPVTMTAIGAIDIALWDIKAKALGVPLYKLLGGSSREKVLVYCHASGRDTDHAMEEVAKKRELGYKAIRIQSGVPGMESIYGISKEKDSYEPAKKGELPEEESWNTSKYLNFVPSLFQRARDEFGYDLHFLHDCHHRLTPNEAAQLGKDLEPYKLFWLEDTVPGELQEGLRLIRQRTTTPLAIGEIFNTVYDCQTLITEQLIDYLRMTVSHSGGITPMMKIAAFAAIYHVKIGMHGPSDVSPIALSACLHVSRAINNLGILEYMGYSDKMSEAFPHEIHYKDGHLYTGNAPGLGVEFNKDFAEKHPYQKAYLPINRLEDGTMFHW
ncbi:D-mannonate dehydratase ManD [Pelagicoccus mobilis]|uniref:D-galactonate dehydratase family protein n=1 Tax=Pelagicoccus mobilis TaxID=415221 RepID=A0A934VPG2_9BACT|nr:D-mannonate dehydratase ManD [Pelagicoccus mobilis]MBK1875498.1 D-galactonate dehydratase family protein [Pelagicoccus mobilis]